MRYYKKCANTLTFTFTFTAEIESWSISAAFLRRCTELQGSAVLPFALYGLSMAYNVTMATSCIINKVK